MQSRPTLLNNLSPVRWCLAGLFSLVAAGAFAAAVPAAAPAAVTVTFDHPDRYTDLKESANDTENDWGQKDYLPQFQEHLVKEATRLLAPGQHLAITVTDIDLAGDFEPWRGPQFSDVRIVKDIYIPRIKLTFKLTDAAGAVVKEGERNLSDMAFQMRMTNGFASDPLRYEKQMLTDWLRDEFPKK
jgi:hypothetical protein